MTPLLACFPVCLTFAGIALLTILVLVLDLGNGIPVNELTASSAGAGKDAPAPWWVGVLMVTVFTAPMLVRAWDWPE
jgi:hypothetical protein